MKKMNVRLRFLYFALFVLFFSCTGGENESVQVDNEKDIAAIKEIIKLYQDAVNNADVATYVDNFAEDVFWAPPNSPIAKSKMEIQNGISKSFNRAKIDLQADSTELKSFGDHAYAIFSGKVTFCSKTEGDTAVLQPACIMLFKKTDGEWKISRQVYNFRNYQE